MSAPATFVGVTADDNANSVEVFDSAGRMIGRITNAGRIDLTKFTNDGAIMVLTGKPATPAVGNRVGHYAFAGINANLQQHSISLIESRWTDITPTAMSSSVSLRYMDAVDGMPGGTYAYQQPNKSVTASSAGLSLPSIPITGAKGLDLEPAATPTAPSTGWRLFSSTDGSLKAIAATGAIVTLATPWVP